MPVPWDAETIYIITGYDINKYKEQRFINTYGLIHNFTVYGCDVHLCILTFFILLFILILLKASILYEYNHSLRRRKRVTLMGIIRKLKIELLKHSAKHTRGFSLILFASFFFISSPFLLMFKTAQVVTKQPRIISSYDDLVKSNATIFYSSLLSDESSFLWPSSRSIEHEDIVYETWMYFLKHGIYYDMRKQRPITFKDMMNLVVSDDAVFFSSFYIAARIREVFCSFSEEEQLLNVLMFKDENQREELNGFAMRKGFVDDILVKKQRRAFEFYFVRHMRRSHHSFYGLDIGDSSPEHRKLQKQVCLKHELTGQMVHVEAGDVEFYFFFFLCILIFFLIAFCIFLLEKYLLVHFGVGSIVHQTVRPCHRNN